MLERNKIRRKNKNITDGRRKKKLKSFRKQKLWQIKSER